MSANAALMDSGLDAFGKVVLRAISMDMEPATLMLLSTALKTGIPKVLSPSRHRTGK